MKRRLADVEMVKALMSVASGRRGQISQARCRSNEHEFLFFLRRPARGLCPHSHRKRRRKANKSGQKWVCSRLVDASTPLTKFRTAVIPKFGSFFCNDLIGQPYGLSYEIVGKNLKLLPPPTLQEVGEYLEQMLSFILIRSIEEDTDATNELIVDTQLVQPLTVKEIKELKQSGAHASVSKT